MPFSVDRSNCSTLGYSDSLFFSPKFNIPATSKARCPLFSLPRMTILPFTVNSAPDGTLKKLAVAFSQVITTGSSPSAAVIVAAPLFAGTLTCAPRSKLFSRVIILSSEGRSASAAERESYPRVSPPTCMVQITSLGSTALVKYRSPFRVSKVSVGSSAVMMSLKEWPLLLVTRPVWVARVTGSRALLFRSPTTSSIAEPAR